MGHLITLQRAIALISMPAQCICSTELHACYLSCVLLNCMRSIYRAFYSNACVLLRAFNSTAFVLLIVRSTVLPACYLSCVLQHCLRATRCAFCSTACVLLIVRFTVLPVCYLSCILQHCLRATCCAFYRTASLYSSSECGQRALMFYNTACVLLMMRSTTLHACYLSCGALFLIINR